MTQEVILNTREEIWQGIEKQTLRQLMFSGLNWFFAIFRQKLQNYRNQMKMVYNKYVKRSLFFENKTPN